MTTPRLLEFYDETNPDVDSAYETHLKISHLVVTLNDLSKAGVQDSDPTMMALKDRLTSLLREYTKILSGLYIAYNNHSV